MRAVRARPGWMSPLLHLAVVALLIVGPAAAQNCAISTLETLPDVVAPCVNFYTRKCSMRAPFPP